MKEEIENVLLKHLSIAHVDEAMKEIELILNKQPFDSKEFLLDIFRNAVLKEDREKYPVYAFFGFDKEGKWIFEYNEKSKIFWLNYSRIWSVLEDENGWDYKQTQEFCNSTVEEHFKLKGATTLEGLVSNNARVEEHFKLKGATTPLRQLSKISKVEEHFKTVNK